MEEHQRRDVQALMAALQQALALEGKFQPRLQLPTASVGSGVVRPLLLSPRFALSVAISTSLISTISPCLL